STGALPACHISACGTRLSAPGTDYLPTTRELSLPALTHKLQHGRQSATLPSMRLFPSALLVGAVLCLVRLSAQASGLTLCSWNLKHLGWNNHKNLSAVAQIMARCDLVGLQEVMYPKHLEPLVQALDAQTGAKWKVTASHTVGGNGYREGYAFIWRVGKVDHAGGDVLYVNPDHEFLRQPFSAVFRATNGSVPAFIAATIHIQYGDGIRDRTPEIRALAKYWGWLG